MPPKKSDFNPHQIRTAIRSYLNGWEDWERENGKEASLSGTERNALTTLFKFALEPFGQELDSENYMSKLNEWFQKKQLTPSTNEEELINSVTGDKQYRVTYELPGVGSFPRYGYGIHPSQEAPSFSQKKRAKQYAAKYTLAWINANSYRNDGFGGTSPEASYGNEDDERTVVDDPVVDVNIKEEPANDDGYHHVRDRPTPSEGNSPIHKKQKIEELDQSIGTSVSPVGWHNVSSQSPTSSNGDDPSSIRQRIDRLARQMGFDAPAFRVKFDVNSQYSCRPVFQLDGRIPERLGFVTDMPTESQAKNESAMQVHFWLINQRGQIEKDIDEVRGKSVDKLRGEYAIELEAR